MTSATKQFLTNQCQFNKGFSLLEVMIAMVIFAVGVLGLAGMQALALENSFESASRNQAIILAYSMSDRMLANQQGKDAYIIDDVTVPTIVTDCNLVNCATIAEIITFDQVKWKQNLAQQLLSGSGAITGASPNYTITVRWDEDRNGVAGTNCPPQSANDLRCFQLQVKL
ncbi:hypothetical protein MNBD_GAMMA22-2636 [hydrothermal vent metagenome]|uniref:Type IV fimbrial biogenesis protein PilV n=1 Tax=hydrothermal vent metagenome TaxID=652676 RepID=A0A3B0ZSR9_9ZZZZ